jgi:hypothetical protein
MISLILPILYSDLLQKHFLCSILVSSGCGSDKTLNSVLLLIGGLVTAVGGILMIIFTWFAPLLVGIVAGLLAIVWGALAAIAYWL